jgi:hypothetical protein
MIITKLHPSQLNTINSPSDENVLTYDLATGIMRWRTITVSGAYTTFLELTDTPSTYTPDKWLKVNPAGTALILTDAPAMSGGSSTFITLTDTPSTYTGQSDKWIKVNVGETGLEFVDAPSGGGSSNFTGLTDTPSTYTGQAGGFVVVNNGETGLEFTTIVESEQTLRYAFFLGVG